MYQNGTFQARWADVLAVELEGIDLVRLKNRRDTFKPITTERTRRIAEFSEVLKRSHSEPTALKVLGVLKLFVQSDETETCICHISLLRRRSA